MKPRKSQLLIAFTVVALLGLVAAAFLWLPRQKSIQPSDPPEKLTIAISTNINPALVKIAEAKEFFRKEGLDVNLQPHTSGKAALGSLLDNKADLATAAETPIMFAMVQGTRLSILATIQTSNRNEAIVARKDRGITAAADLKGHSIGVTLGTTGHFFLDSFLVINGIDLKEVKIVDLKPEAMSDALLQGKVDAVSTWNPLVTNIQKALGNRGVTLFSEGIYTETFNLVTLPEFIRKRPDTARRILRALVNAEEFVATHPSESQQIISQFSNINRESLADLWSNFQFNLSLRQSLLVTLEDQARWAMERGLTEKTHMPNFLDALYIEGLKTVKPDSVRIIR